MVKPSPMPWTIDMDPAGSGRAMLLDADGFLIAEGSHPRSFSLTHEHCRTVGSRGTFRFPQAQ